MLTASGFRTAPLLLDRLQRLASASHPFCTDNVESAVECVVVGAGVVGLACARALAQFGREVVLLDKGPSFGTETSARHSEVIHAGLYYAPGTLKAKLCVEGKEQLYEYLQSKGVPHRRMGKLIVATSKEQLPNLQDMQRTAAANGVHDTQLMSAEEAIGLEPEVRCAGALLSPSSGVFDSHSYMEALLADAEAAGAAVATRSRVLGGVAHAHTPAAPSPGGATLDVEDAASGERSRLRARWVVNAAGLHAQAVAHSFAGVPQNSIPPLWLAKGNYAALSGVRAPFSRLVYPIPEDGGLGTHLTLDMAGQAKFGPDVEWLPHSTDPNTIDYSVDPARAQRCYAAVRSYWPGLPDGALQPSYSGVRPKVAGPGEAPGDFVIQGRVHHGVRGLVCLYGIESPGLTSSLAIAERVLALLRRDEEGSAGRRGG